MSFPDMPYGIAGAIQSLMVLEHDLGDGPVKLNVLQHVEGYLGMIPDQGDLAGDSFAGLG